MVSYRSKIGSMHLSHTRRARPFTARNQESLVHALVVNRDANKEAWSLIQGAAKLNTSVGEVRSTRQCYALARVTTIISSVMKNAMDNCNKIKEILDQGSAQQ